MHSQDSDSISGTGEKTALRVVSSLRPIVLHVPAVPQRRRAPRRRMVAAFSIERRRGDRRHAKPGIDGLLRMVLADDWK